MIQGNIISLYLNATMNISRDANADTVAGNNDRM